MGDPSRRAARPATPATVLRSPGLRRRIRAGGCCSSGWPTNSLRYLSLGDAARWVRRDSALGWRGLERLGRQSRRFQVAHGFSLVGADSPPPHASHRL